MIIRSIEVGPFAANCYVLVCPSTREAAVIDPGGDAPVILQVILQERAKVKYIINTHGHVDHVGANAQVKSATNAEILIHEKDAPMLTNPARNLAILSPVVIRQVPADRTLKEGDEIEFGEIKMEVIHTPGHTPGSISLKTDKIIFTGDTLFAGSIGRTDFPGGSYEQIMESIKNKIATLGDDYKVFPGHGPSTSVGYERVSNPFLQGDDSWRPV